MISFSAHPVFNHGDIAPRNIMVDQKNRITGMLDWENSGWYPNYWETANIMKVTRNTEDWHLWMVRKAAQKGDVTATSAARGILF